MINWREIEVNTSKPLNDLLTISLKYMKSFNCWVSLLSVNHNKYQWEKPWAFQICMAYELQLSNNVAFLEINHSQHFKPYWTRVNPSVNTILYEGKSQCLWIHSINWTLKPAISKRSVQQNPSTVVKLNRCVFRLDLTDDKVSDITNKIQGLGPTTENKECQRLLQVEE